MIAVLVPVLRRPHRVEPLLASIEAATPAPHRVVFIASPGDTAEHDAVRSTGNDLLILSEPPGVGDWAKKINYAVDLTTEPLLFFGADDLNFHAGWLEAAHRRLKPGIGVVGTNDLGNRRTMTGQHATHMLVTRDYCTLGTIDDPTRPLPECYPHEFVDDEFVGTAKKREAWAFARDSIVEHLHPLWGKAPMDELYAQHPHRMEAGRRIWQQRRHLWT